ncbi:hypothetical protein WH47_11661 [Habropoda laboriosa]|uniref:Uncharacterized protein n=1 Tax=Habropoda laboriosa TaxID=597456 RepID=A0A0L7R9D3_9HYME|nr:hypothetical protein WH47_11661 [Habropoda laboriosa]
MDSRPAIKWSPSVNGRDHKLSWRFRKRELFPPFLQNKLPDFLSDLEEYVETPGKHIMFGDRFTICRNLDSSQPENLNPQEENFFVPCKDDCRTSKLMCAILHDKSDAERISAREITDTKLDAFEPRVDQDYQRFEGDFVDEQPKDEDEGEMEDEEVEEEEQEEKRRLPWMGMCETPLSSSDCEEEEPPDTTDPYISHKLRVLPGKFDAKTAYEEWERKERTAEARKQLEESKQRVSRSIRRLSEETADENVLISSVVLEAVCEEVTLTLMDAKIDTSIHTFVNIAVIWALSELESFNRDMLSDEQLRLPEEFMLYDRKNMFEMTGINRLRKMLLGVYRPPFSRNMYTTLHRRLPWPYVSPSHERGHTKFYPNVRERVEEKSPNTILDNAIMRTATYIPDMRCFHRGDVLDISQVAYRRKTKYYSLPTISRIRLMEDMFVQLVSFM